MNRLKIEFEAARMLYQGISTSPQGALDTGLLTNRLAQPSIIDDQRLINVEGLDSVKGVLFLHSKLCMSDPDVTVNARNSDQANKAAAENAQRYIPYMKDHVGLQEKIEAGPYLNCCINGTGILYTGWDTDGGEYPLTEIPEGITPEQLQQLDIKMEGDYDVRSVATENFLIDASAKTFDDANFVFEEVKHVPIEKALFTFNEEWQHEILKSYCKEHSTEGETDETSETRKKNTVTLWEYWERGRPWNGFLGAHCVFVDPRAPKLLMRRANPFDHKRLPYNLLTDIDVPEHPYGMSRLVYVYQVQRSVDTMLSLIMNNIALHGSAKMLMPEGGVNDEAMTNDPRDITFFNAATGGKPDWFRPTNVTTDVWQLYSIFRKYIESIYGMGEFSQGQIPRELSSYAVQLALEADDKYRIRLFNKKRAFLKSAYTYLLEVTKQYMTDERKLKIVGVEGFTGNEYFSAVDLKGDYDLDILHGVYLPEDPGARKTQLLEFVKSGLYEKAGGDMRKLASLLVDSDMLGVKDALEMAYKLQQNETRRIIKGEEIQVEVWDKDEEHLRAIDDFVSTEEFNILPRDIKDAIWNHSQVHVDKLAEKIAKSKPKEGEPGAEGEAPAGAEMPQVPPTSVTNPSLTAMTKPTSPLE